MVHCTHCAIGKGLTVKPCRFFGIFVIPQANRVLGHCVSFPLFNNNEVPEFHTEYRETLDITGPELAALRGHEQIAQLSLKRIGQPSFRLAEAT